MEFLTNINLNKNELQNARVQNLATAPQNPAEGQIYYNTTDKTIYKWDGVQWSAMGSAYTLPVATAQELGGIKVGSGVTVAADGTLDANVQSVAGKTGAVTLDKADVGLGNVDNTSDANKPVSTAVQTALDAKQDELVSGTSIKTINSESLLGSGDISVATQSDLDDYLALAGGTMTGDIAMGNNSITGLAEPTNSSDAANKGYVDTIATGALKPSGSIAFASLPALSASVLNNMYNVTDAFTSTSDFTDGGGVSYPAGTNVAIINTGTESSPVYEYDAMTGVIDTSSFATKTDVNGLITATTGTISTSATTATVNYTGTLLEAYATQGGNKVVTDMTISASSVVFTCASAPSAAITCTVVAAGTLS